MSRVKDSGLLGFRVKDLGFKVEDLGLSSELRGFRVRLEGCGFRVCRPQGARLRAACFERRDFGLRTLNMRV